jgi:hypothetical protein
LGRVSRSSPNTRLAIDRAALSEYLCLLRRISVERFLKDCPGTRARKARAFWRDWVMRGKLDALGESGVLCYPSWGLRVRARVGGGERRRASVVSGFWWTDGRRPSGEVGQAIKCTWWMPRHEPAMKDVASCEKLRGAASERRSGDVRMGKPGRVLSPVTPTGEPTQGTETSQYLEEEKSTEIP